MGDVYFDVVVDQVIFKLVDQGWLGCKIKVGFYDYDDVGKCQGFWFGFVMEWLVEGEQFELIQIQYCLMFV